MNKVQAWFYNLYLTLIIPYCEEFRISKFARWTSNFTPPTQKYGTTSSSYSGGSTIEWQNKTVSSGSSYTIQCNSKDFQFGKKDFTIDFWVTFPEYNQFLTRRFLRRE